MPGSWKKKYPRKNIALISDDTLISPLCSDDLDDPERFAVIVRMAIVLQASYLLDVLACLEVKNIINQWQKIPNADEYLLNVLTQLERDLPRKVYERIAQSLHVWFQSRS